MFNTYQKEEEQVVYGVTTNIKHPSNPFHINFHEYSDMLKDVRTAQGWRMKFFFVFGSPTKIAAYKVRQKAKEIG
jgi:hypothetical protein